MIKNLILPPIFILDFFENGDVRDGRKEQDTGAELNGVSPEDFIGRTLVVEDGFTYFHKPLFQHGMFDIGLGFFTSIDAVKLGYP